MKAIYIAEPGGPDKLIFGDRPDPQAGPGEVIVRVRGTALNHADLSIRGGRAATGGPPRNFGLHIPRGVARPRAPGTRWEEGDPGVVEEPLQGGTRAPRALRRG